MQEVWGAYQFPAGEQHQRRSQKPSNIPAYTRFNDIADRGIYSMPQPRYDFT